MLILSPRRLPVLYQGQWDNGAAATHPAQGESSGTRRSMIHRSLPALAVLAVEVLSERVEALAEERSELVNPAHDILQRLGMEPV
jgi:hypothetical protein